MRLLVIFAFCVAGYASPPPMKVILTQRTRDDRQNIQVRSFNKKVGLSRKDDFVSL